MRQAKLSIHRGLQSSLRDGLALEIEAYNRMVPTEDRREGVLAFNEKRSRIQGPLYFFEFALRSRYGHKIENEALQE